MKTRLIIIISILLLLIYPIWYGANWYAAGLIDQTKLIEYNMVDDFFYCQEWRPELFNKNAKITYYEKKITYYEKKKPDGGQILMIGSSWTKKTYFKSTTTFQIPMTYKELFEMTREGYRNPLIKKQMSVYAWVVKHNYTDLFPYFRHKAFLNKKTAVQNNIKINVKLQNKTVTGDPLLLTIEMINTGPNDVYYSISTLRSYGGCKIKIFNTNGDPVRSIGLMRTTIDLLPEMVN